MVMSRGLVALCAGYLLTGSASFAASDVSPEAPAIPSMLVDRETETLLHAVEQQIAIEHVVSPANDNAMETWRRVLQRKVTTQDSPGVLRALADFETRVRIRAANEKAAGNNLVSSALIVFADEANRLTGNMPQSNSHGTTAPLSGAATRDSSAEPAGIAEPASGAATRDSSAEPAGTTEPASGAATRDVPIDRAASEPQAPGPAPAAPNPRGADVALAPIQTPPRDRDTPDTAAAAGGADTTAAGATSAVGNPALTAPGSTVPSVTRPPTSREPAIAAFYATRGDEMLALKDISAARKLYEYAADAGSARAATALARTFDAAFVTQLGVVGLKPDPALAATWYRKAAALGDPQSDTQLLTQRAETAK
jgi:hypothetical protein